MTFEKELYAVVRKWNPSPDFEGCQAVLQTKMGDIYVTKPKHMPETVLRPTMQLRFEKLRYGEHLQHSTVQLQQLWRSDTAEEWRAVPAE